MRKIQTSLYTLALLVILCIQPLHSQGQQKIHSHNDYRQLVPFYQAYLQRVASIEVDIFYHDNLLLVGHDLEDLDNEYTISKLYLDPIVELFKKNGGTAWPDSDEKMILLVRKTQKVGFSHGRLFILCNAMFLVLLVEVRRIGKYFLGRLVGIRKEKHFGVPVFGMGHKVAIRLHVFPQGVGGIYSINPDDRARIVFISISGHFFIIAFQVSSAWLREGIPKDPDDHDDH